MPRLTLTTHIGAPSDRCFDLSRSVDVHVRSAASTAERAIAGKTTGLLALGEEVTWRARHLGIAFTLSSRITQFERPHHFRDSMVSGPLAFLDHDHFFTSDGQGGTVMQEIFEYAAPWSVFGRLAESLFLTRHFRRFLTDRNEVIKRLAESDAWKEFLPSGRTS